MHKYSAASAGIEAGHDLLRVTLLLTLLWRRLLLLMPLLQIPDKNGAEMYLAANFAHATAYWCVAASEGGMCIRILLPVAAALNVEAADFVAAPHWIVLSRASRLLLLLLADREEADVATSACS